VPPQVAAVVPAPAPEKPPVDIRSALGRGGGAGGARGGGRGGIEGEPIPLDTTDPKYSDYLDRLRRRIKANWGFPCITNIVTRGCDYKTTSLVVEFGILKDGRLQFVEVIQSSGFAIYDDYAVNAIKLASPFPAVPPAMIVATKRGSTGVAILARFNYVVDTSLTNLLR
jgi:TonB family protein